VVQLHPFILGFIDGFGQQNKNMVLFKIKHFQAMKNAENQSLSRTGKIYHLFVLRTSTVCLKQFNDPYIWATVGFFRRPLKCRLFSQDFHREEQQY
jgi:hypothetical protein